MPPSKADDKQMIKATIAGTPLVKISIEPELEPFYRRAAGLAATGKGGTINKFYEAFKEDDRGQHESILLRRTLLELGYRMEFMKEELRQLQGEFSQINEEIEECFALCSEGLS